MLNSAFVSYRIVT